MTKKRIKVVLCGLLAIALLCACAAGGGVSEEPAAVNGGAGGDSGVGSNAADVVGGAFSTKAFANEVVPDDLLTQILQAGVKAPSAMNSQPWKFVVVRGAALRASILGSVPDGCAIVLVIVPAENYGPGGNSQFAAGTAAESMYLMAQALGLGAHMYTAPAEGINNNAQTREVLGMEDGYEVAVVLCFGYMENEADAISGATERNELESFVSYAD